MISRVFMLPLNARGHGFDLVDHDTIWSTITEDLPPLIAELEKIL